MDLLQKIKKYQVKINFHQFFFYLLYLLIFRAENNYYLKMISGNAFCIVSRGYQKCIIFRLFIGTLKVPIFLSAKTTKRLTSIRQGTLMFLKSQSKVKFFILKNFIETLIRYLLLQEWSIHKPELHITQPLKSGKTSHTTPKATFGLWDAYSMKWRL